MGGAVISGVIMGLCALLMIGIGISQIKSRKPVGFYTGEKAPEAKDLTDVSAWNKKHGAMWILYGIGIALTWVCGLLLGDSLLMLIPFFIGLLLPLPCMILYHNKLAAQYMIK